MAGILCARLLRYYTTAFDREVCKWKRKKFQERSSKDCHGITVISVSCWNPVRSGSRPRAERTHAGNSIPRSGQDLNNFGGFGQQGYGYNVKHLHTEIGKILGLDQDYNMIIIGAGNLGQALANYVKFEKNGFLVKGLFDVNPKLKGVAVRGIVIRMTDELPAFLQEHDIQIAALTLPKQYAKEMADLSGGSRHPCNLEFCPYGSSSAGRCDHRKRTSFGKPDAAVLQYQPLQQRT